VPNTIGAVAAAGLPRTLTPMLKLDFADDSYQQSGSAKSLLDIVTYSRSSSATFINRQVNQYGQYEYFIDNDYVGDVENLLTYSEQFDNSAWTKGSVASVTANTTKAPDGTTSADLLYPNASGSTAYIQSTSTANTSDHTLSVYAKASGKQYIRLTTVDLLDSAYFDVLRGVVGDVSSGATASIEFVGDGWFRCSITGSGAVSAQSRILITDNNASSSISADGKSGVYLWGAQLTESAKVLPYVKTVDTTVTKAFTETVRREYDPETGENLGALIEGGSTNLLTRSEEFDNADWSKYQATVTANATKAPDGTMSADKLTASTTISRAYQAPTVTSGQEYTYSAYFKNIDSVKTHFKVDTSSKTVNINWSGNTITSLSDVSSGATASYKKIGDFYRVDLTFTTTSTTEQCRIYPDLANGTGSIYAWGAQLEQKPFATSYIRTEGAAVSRTADVLSVDNFSLPSEGSVSVTADYIGGSDLLDSGRYALSFNDGTGANRVLFNNGYSTPNRTYIAVGGALQASITTGAATDQATTTTLTFKPNDAVLYRDGAQVGTDTSCLIPVTTKINIGFAFNGGSHLYGHIAEFSTYNTALTAQEVSIL